MKFVFIFTCIVITALTVTFDEKFYQPQNLVTCNVITLINYKIAS